jgi:hypothetical protein
MVMAILLLGATLSIFQTNSRYYYNQQSILEQEQNLRTAMYAIAREVRMAGDGLSVMGVSSAQIYLPNPAGGGAWFRYSFDGAGPSGGSTGVRALFGHDRDDGPDSLTIFRSAVESAMSFGQLAEGFSYSDNQLVFVQPILEGQVVKGDVLGVVNGKTAVLLEADYVSPPGSANGVIRLGSRFKPGSSFPGGAYFPAGSYVYNLRDVSMTTFFIDQADSNLMAKYHHFDSLHYDSVEESAIIVAPGVEDLQVRYVLNDQDPGQGFDGLSMGALENNNVVRQVNIGLVGKSSSRSPAVLHSPVNLFNHFPDGPKDGHYRNVVTTMVHLRNY